MSYYNKLVKMTTDLEPGGIYQAVIRHDAGCPYLLGVGPCSCDATIETTRMNRKARRAKNRRRS
jgi:hypothetical protein